MSEVKQCEKFVRNAWKKELCSNCFKSKEEHPAVKTVEVPKVHAKLPDPPKEGILKTVKSKPGKGNKVIFPSNEFEVIGYGGDDVFSDDDDEPDFRDNPPSKEEADTDEDKALQRLTKANTDFNSVPANLQEPKPGEGKKVVEPLRLGKQITDDTGKKKTLVVSVTPFGGASVNTSPRVRVHPKVVENKDKVEEKPVENEESKSENGEASVLENTAAETVPSPPKVVTEIGIKRSQPLDKNSKFRLNKDPIEETKRKEAVVEKEENRVSLENKLNDRLTTSGKVANLLDKAKKKVHHLPVIGDPQHFKFKTIDFAANKKTIQETNKAVVLDMYDLREETKDSNEKTDVPVLEVKTTPAIIGETKKSEDCPAKVKPVANMSSLHRVVAQEVEAPAVVEVSLIEENKGSVEPPNKEETDTSNETEEPPKNDCSNDENAQPKAEDIVHDKLVNYERVLNGEEVTLFSVGEGSEERCAPDGRADPEVPAEVGKDVAETPPEEVPALPTSPPPILDPRTSFLHSLTGGGRRIMGEKPKVPTKPVIIQNKKHVPVPLMRPKSPSMETFLDASPTVKPHPPLSETLSDSVKKRQAPKPPSPGSDRAPQPLPDNAPPSPALSPVRIPRVESPLRVARSTENILELSRDSPIDGRSDVNGVPEPSPRRSLSLSQDSLIHSGISEVQAKKKSPRGRFSLRKLLHFGKNKENCGKESPGDLRHVPLPPCTKPKPEIIHPLDLTGTRVEVVPPHRMAKSRRSSSSASSSSGEHRESDIPSDSSASQSVSSGNSTHEIVSTLERARKPPPPPRNVNQELTPKPARPPPPKNIAELKRDNEEQAKTPQRLRDNVYVNLGEARVGLAPNKPVRTGSLRGMEGKKKLSSAAEKHLWTGSLRHGFSDGCKKIIPNVNMAAAAPEDSGYESFDVSLTTTDSQTSSLTGDENVYECVQPSAELRSSCSPRTQIRGHRRSEGNVPDVAQDYIKYRFLRSVSVPYCGSEAESDIYSPYSFCGSEMGDDEYEWSPTSGRFQKVSRLKTKKGRSVVHKSLEDNYGAVVIANHEALTQVVEQMHLGPTTPASLRNLSVAPSLRWSDFTLVRDVNGVTVERRMFYPALWGAHPVTLCLSLEQGFGSGIYGKTPFSLIPLTELHDLVPASFLVGGDPKDEELVQCTISVFSRLQIDTLQNYSQTTSNGSLTDELKKEINFVLLQIINALKTLQVQGIEEVPRGLRNMTVCREERDPYPRVCLIPVPGPEKDCTSLCGCVLDFLAQLPPTELSLLLTTTLREEKAVSLSQAKALLEFTLWGPADIAWGASAREPALQRWLDLERATVLQGLVRTRADLTIFEIGHLLFLVRTNAKMMAEASLLLEAQASSC